MPTAKTAKVYSFTKSNPPVFAGVTVKQHDEGCKYDKTLDNRKACDCWKCFYINPGRLRISANTRSWGVAETRGNAWVAEHTPGTKESVVLIDMPILAGFDDFIEDKKKSGVKKNTLKKIRTIRTALKKFIEQWNKEHKAAERLEFTHQLQLEPLKRFFHTWEGLSGKTIAKRRGYMRNFFDHCLQHGWNEMTGEMMPKGEKQIPKDNPANFIKVHATTPAAEDKLPLSDELYAALLRECYLYENSLGSRNKQGSGERAAIFWELMYSTGFAITDAYISQRSRLLKRGDADVFDLNRKKTGSPVYVKLDPDFAERLRNVPRGKKEAAPDRFFWSGTGEAEDAADSYAKLFPRLIKRILKRNRKLVEDSCLKDAEGNLILPTPHCLRYNFAENLFLEGATIPEVARLIGDTPEVVEKHYWKMSKKVQARLDELVDKVNSRRKMIEVIVPTDSQVVTQAAQA